MVLYVQKVKILTTKFELIEVERVPRVINVEANVLTMLASGMTNENSGRVPIQRLDEPTNEMQE